MAKNFEERLKGGHPNSLGNTLEIVEEVLQNNNRFDELYHCYFSDDEVVRLRTSNAIKRICKEKKTLLIPYVDRLLDEIAPINQASTQWTLANLFAMLEKDMSSKQLVQAKHLLKHNLAHHDDWIVLNNTMETLAHWAKNDEELKQWLIPQVNRLKTDRRKSVASRAMKISSLL